MNRLKKILQSKILKAGAIYTLGNIFVKGVNFISIPIFTRIMTVEDYGLMNNFASLVSILTVVVGLSLNGAISNAKFDYQDRFEKFLSSVLFLSTLSFLLFFLLGNAYYLFFDSLFSVNQVIFNYLIVQSYSLFVVQYVLSLFTIKTQPIRFLVVSLLSTLITIGLSLAFMVTVFQTDMYLGRVIGSTVGLLVLALALYILIMHRGRELVNVVYWKYALVISLPLIPHQLSTIILSRFDQTMINTIVGPYESGLYSFVLNISIVLSVLWSSSNSAWVPWLYEHLENKSYPRILKQTNRYLLFFSLVTIASMAVLIDIGRLMAGEKYVQSLVLMVPIMLSYFFQFLYSLPVNIEFYYKKTSLIALGTVGSALIKLALNAITLPVWGYQAAAYTTILAYILLFVFHFIIYRKISEDRLIDLKMVLAMIAFVLASGVFLHMTLGLVWLRYLYLLIVLFGGLIFLRQTTKYSKR